MNKYSGMFNGNMSTVEASNLFFKMAKEIKEEDRDELIEAWTSNSFEISKRIKEELGDNPVLTNEII